MECEGTEEVTYARNWEGIGHETGNRIRTIFEGIYERNCECNPRNQGKDFISHWEEIYGRNETVKWMGRNLRKK